MRRHAISTPQACRVARRRASQWHASLSLAGALAAPITSPAKAQESVGGVHGTQANARIVVLTPAGASASVNAATARVIGELVGVGFPVREATMRRGSSPRDEVERADVAADALAVFAIVETAAGPEIWISDRARSITTTKRPAAVDGDAQRQTSALAFAAVELLRTSLAEPWRRLEAERATSAPARAMTIPPAVSARPTVAAATDANVRWAPEALMGARALAGVGVYVFGAGVRATFALTQALSLAPELEVAGGSDQVEGARASVLLATAAMAARVRVAAAPLDMELGAGVRGGVVRLSGAATPAWAPRAGVGPWAGPSVGVAVRTKRRAGLQVGLDLEAGYALLASAGTAPNGGEVALDGPWVALRAGFGWWR